MTEAQHQQKPHTITLHDRTRLTATGVTRVDFFSEELICAQTGQGQLNIKGEGLHMEELSAQSGDLLVQGKITALSYTENVSARSVLGRLFK